MKDDTFDFGGDPKKLLFALQAAGTADVAGPLRRLLDAGTLTGVRRSEVLLALAKYGGPDDLRRVLAAATARRSEAGTGRVVAAGGFPHPPAPSPAAAGEGEGVEVACPLFVNPP